MGSGNLSNNPEPTTASNETCVVQLGQIDGKKILLTRRPVQRPSCEAPIYPRRLGCCRTRLVQVPHQVAAQRDALCARPLARRPHEDRRRDDRERLLLGRGQPAGVFRAAQVKNAFIRRGYRLCDQTHTKTHFSGYPGVVLASFRTEPFDYWWRPKLSICRLAKVLRRLHHQSRGVPRDHRGDPRRLRCLSSGIVDRSGSVERDRHHRLLIILYMFPTSPEARQEDRASYL